MNRRNVTLKDVAEAVGVHVSTVSRALDPKSRHLITPAVAEKVLRVSAEMKYRPNASAYGLRTSRTRTIGVTVPDITNPIFPPIIRGIEDGLEARGYAAIIASTDSRPERDLAVTENLLARGVDGLITASVPLQDEPIAQIVRSGKAVVTVNRRIEAPFVSSVVSDEEDGICRVVEHLVGLGHRRIAHVAGPQELSTGRWRCEAFRKAGANFGLPLDDALIVYAGRFREEEGERCARELLGRAAGITAIVCANDRLALGALDALAGLGLSCPADVSVTGFNDMPMVERLQPPLTTVRIQQYEAGLKAAEIVLNLIESGSGMEPVHAVLPVALVVRGSTAEPRSERRTA
ncbi:MAG TPA: LacI family DNA-binding transcriptional regulator [Afifellaceae bacterium]|nr:LacI family DNA-binding transcriptional regulator [Afifellaceae bacterium]